MIRFDKTESDFQAWKKLVNQRVLEKCGMECDDLPDYNYWQAYANYDSPGKVASQAIANAKKY